MNMGRRCAGRLEVLCKHVTPATEISSEACFGLREATTAATPPVGETQRAEKSEPSRGEIGRAYRRSLEMLVKEGQMPPLTAFDVPRMRQPSEKALGQLLDRAEAEGALELLERLPGPWAAAKTRDEKVRLLAEIQRAASEGSLLNLIADFQLLHGAGLGSNIAVPVIAVHSDCVCGPGSNLGTERTAERMRLVARVIVADGGDAERLSRLHTQKEPNFGGFFDSVISTNDNAHWQKQRRHLSEAFLPLSSLAKIFPVSLARARKCADRLAELARSSPRVDMSDFLLHEAQAQLQLALLGCPEAFMDDSNAKIRKVFMEHPEGRIGDVSSTMKGLYEMVQSGDHALPSDGCPVKAPLSRAVQIGDFDRSTDFGNLLLILFAGHDTTGHTMTWLLFELARHPDIQQKIHEEVDTFFAKLDGRLPEYRDLAELGFLDRCITETLRLWPAVANGTFRELQSADTIRGAQGVQVDLPRGTFVNIVNWSRHRDPAQWGVDADVFNPWRDFAASELAHVGCPMAATNPQSKRFSPFAHNPRSCLGKNFAQMEMRLIVAYLMRNFTFGLAPPYDSLGALPIGAGLKGESVFRGVNRGGTMGPLDLEKGASVVPGEKPLVALKLTVAQRRAN